MTNVIVCGGRRYTDTARVYAELDKILAARPGLLIIHGGAPGADQRAGEWAAERGIPCAEVKALWNYYGKDAGPRRNLWMLRLNPQGVVAFPGGAGTENMKRAAREVGLPVMEVG